MLINDRELVQTMCNHQIWNLASINKSILQTPWWRKLCGRVYSSSRQAFRGVQKHPERSLWVCTHHWLALMLFHTALVTMEFTTPECKNVIKNHNANPSIKQKELKQPHTVCSWFEIFTKIHSSSCLLFSSPVPTSQHFLSGVYCVSETTSLRNLPIHMHAQTSIHWGTHTEAGHAFDPGCGLSIIHDATQCLHLEIIRQWAGLMMLNSEERIFLQFTVHHHH